jgi:UDP-3-O-[3-hydroxymyristoyl] N-acetylglucosamine deacetylase
VHRTLASTASFAGIGLHSGRPARLLVRPARVRHGIVFKRLDVPGTESLIPALWDRVIVSPLNTRIENRFGHSVSTIEHLMAALAGCGVQNALIEIAGPEVPILDGSAAVFVRGIMAAGLRQQAAPLDVIEILQPVEVRQGAALARLDPAPGVSMDFTIEFADAAIGHQRKVLDLSNGAFVRELCDSRTFCRRADIEAMQATGKALGGTFDNAVVVDGADVLSPGGFRHKDEAVRHKMLDALGDLSTAGAPILGHYTGNRAGHALTNQLLRALFATPQAWRLREADAALAARLPGAGLAPADLVAVA